MRPNEYLWLVVPDLYFCPRLVWGLVPPLGRTTPRVVWPMTCTEMKETGELLKFLGGFVPKERANDLLLLVNAAMCEWSNQGHQSGANEATERFRTRPFGNKQYGAARDTLFKRLDAMESALKSIAANGCCGPCQEARLVAQAALAKVLS